MKPSVLEALKWEPRVNEAHIGVTVKAGVVTLMCHVESSWEKDAAERVARAARRTCGQSPMNLKFVVSAASSGMVPKLPPPRSSA
jgi:hypothetical protein